MAGAFFEYQKLMLNKWFPDYCEFCLCSTDTKRNQFFIFPRYTINNIKILQYTRK